MFVKIVYPGGNIEVHDQPIPVSDLIKRNPKCCVARPTVFHDPYAVVSPNATLALGQKYYVVPIVTVRRLQLKYSASQTRPRNENERTVGVGIGGKRSLPLTSFDHWKPDLQSIMED